MQPKLSRETKLTEHFTLGELTKPDMVVPDDQVLINLVKLCCALEDLRLIINAYHPRPDGSSSWIIITSGLRSVERNTAVGGSPKSQHLLGLAADCYCPQISLRSMATLATHVPAFNNGGIGVYPDNGFCHLDCRLNGPARWLFVNGKMLELPKEWLE